MESYLLALIEQAGHRRTTWTSGTSAVSCRAATPRRRACRADWIDVVAAELANNRSRSIVLAGTKPAADGARPRACAQRRLENVGHTVVYAHVTDVAEGEQVAGHSRALATDAMDGGQVQTLVILGGNPVYDAPGDLDFAGKLGQVRTSFHLSSFRDETSERASWHVPRAHYLES